MHTTMVQSVMVWNIYIFSIMRSLLDFSFLRRPSLQTSDVPSGLKKPHTSGIV